MQVVLGPFGQKKCAQDKPTNRPAICLKGFLNHHHPLKLDFFIRNKQTCSRLNLFRRSWVFARRKKNLYRPFPLQTGIVNVHELMWSQFQKLAHFPLLFWPKKWGFKRILVHSLLHTWWPSSSWTTKGSEITFGLLNFVDGQFETPAALEVIFIWMQHQTCTWGWSLSSHRKNPLTQWMILPLFWAWNNEKRKILL